METLDGIQRGLDERIRGCRTLEHGVCAGMIDARCGQSQSTVSAHLAALKRAGLVSSKQVGPFVFFKRNEAAIQAFVDYIKADF